MNHATKKEQVLKQYVYQYVETAHKQLTALRANKDNLHLPYALFLFSLIDYFGLLYRVAYTKQYNKRDKNNFLDFFASSYFPSNENCKGSFLYFVRNGLVHQIFAKGCGVGTSSLNQLFVEDNLLKDEVGYPIPVLNIEYLDIITESAIKKFIFDLESDLNSDYIDNLYDMLIVHNYGLNDSIELQKEIANSLNSDKNNIFKRC